MRCQACHRSMRPMFMSCVCDYCDGLVEIDWHRGYIVFRGDEDFARPVYVFPSRTDAAIYRSYHGWQTFPILEIRYEHPVGWRTAIGDLEGVTIAERPFALYPDHRFPSAPFAGHLAPRPVGGAASSETTGVILRIT